MLLRSTVALAAVLGWPSQLHLLLFVLGDAAVGVLLVVDVTALSQVLLGVAVANVDVGLVVGFIHDVHVVRVTLVVVTLRLQVVLALVHEHLLLQLAAQLLPSLLADRLPIGLVASDLLIEAAEGVH